MLHCYVNTDTKFPIKLKNGGGQSLHGNDKKKGGSLEHVRGQPFFVYYLLSTAY